METSRKGMEFIADREGVKLLAYQDIAGIWTIGIGHTEGVKKGDVIDMNTALKFLKKDLKVAESAVNSLELELTQNQFDALVSLAFNIGSGAFKNSTLAKVLKQTPNDRTRIKKAWKQWRMAGGKVVFGLEMRRKAELELFYEDEN